MRLAASAAKCNLEACDSLEIPVPEHDSLNKAEILRCVVLLALILLCWHVLNGRIMDAAQVTFIYRNF